MRRAIFVLLAFVILYPLTYLSLLAISNAIFGDKNVSAGTNSPGDMKRKKVLKITAVPVALFILSLLASFLSAAV